MHNDIATQVKDEGRPELGRLITSRPVKPKESVTRGPVILGPVTLDTIQSLHPPLTQSLSLSLRTTGKTVVFLVTPRPILPSQLSRKALSS